jgi:serine/threonine protein kinase
MEKLEFGRQLKLTLMGEARYGRALFRARDGSQHWVEVFIKSFSKQCVLQGKTKEGIPVRENPRVELSLQAKLSNNDCPYLVRLLDVKDGGSEILAVMEYCHGGELFSLIQSAGSAFTSIHARTYFIQLLLGLQAIHSLGIAHRDLSLENLMIHKDSNLRIGDFGLSIEVKRDAESTEPMRIQEESAIGKIKYMPPELFSTIPYDPFKGDIWSSAVILFVMLFRVFPWNLPHASDPLFVLICSGRVNEVMKAWNQPPLEPALIDLFSNIFCPEENRWSISMILQHPYLREVWENNPKHVQESIRATQRVHSSADQNESAHYPSLTPSHTFSNSFSLSHSHSPSQSSTSAADNEPNYFGSLDSDSVMRSLPLTPAIPLATEILQTHSQSRSLFPNPASPLVIQSIPQPTPLFNESNQPVS